MRRYLDSVLQTEMLLRVGVEETADGVHLDTATVRKRMGIVALAVPSQLSASLGRDFAKGEGAASPSAGDSRRYNGDSIKMPPPRSSRSMREDSTHETGIRQRDGHADHHAPRGAREGERRGARGRHRRFWLRWRGGGL